MNAAAMRRVGKGAYFQVEREGGRWVKRIYENAAGAFETSFRACGEPKERKVGRRFKILILPWSV